MSYCGISNTESRFYYQEREVCLITVEIGYNVTKGTEYFVVTNGCCYNRRVKWVPVTTAWRVLRLWMEERPPVMEGSCEYTE
jgi:hypothetical protein